MKKGIVIRPDPKPKKPRIKPENNIVIIIQEKLSGRE